MPTAKCSFPGRIGRSGGIFHRPDESFGKRDLVVAIEYPRAFRPRALSQDYPSRQCAAAASTRYQRARPQVAAACDGLVHGRMPDLQWAGQYQTWCEPPPRFCANGLVQQGLPLVTASGAGARSIPALRMASTNGRRYGGLRAFAATYAGWGVSEGVLPNRRLQRLRGKGP